jgi:hypothetical protein
MDPRHKAKDDNRVGVAYLWILGIKPRMTIRVVYKDDNKGGVQG